MSRRHSLIVLIAGLAIGATRPLLAQSPNDLLARGVAAYQALDYDQAAALLRRSLTRDSSSGEPLIPVARAKALSYLGATEIFRGRRDSAVAAFRALVLLDPRYHPDELVFPPKVTALYQEVRKDTRTLALEAPPLTRIHGRIEPFAARIISSSLADVTVAIERADGTRLRTLYAGPVADSMTVLWDGLAADGKVPSDGRYALRVTSRGNNAARGLTIPLDIKQLETDTLPWPHQPALLPEHTSSSMALRSLGAGVVAGAAAFALPAIVSRGTTASSARFALGLGLTATGVAGFLMHRPGRPIPENMDANRTKRAAWQEDLASVRNENASRRTGGGARLEIRAGPVSVALAEDSP